VETALAMRDAVHAAIDQGGGADLLIMAAAVADFRPERTAEQKIKKGDDATLELRLVRNPDILGELAARRDLIKVGFAAETEALLENAQEKLRRKGLDLIVANEAVASIGAPESQITLIGVDGEARRLERLPKAQSAGAILDEVLRRFPDLAAART
jgi:phosphopantothenoylcysteine decarboxylase / phosphopantothenate---cysteine ligase